jgi:hypothetical protein
MIKVGVLGGGRKLGKSKKKKSKKEQKRTKKKILQLIFDSNNSVTAITDPQTPIVRKLRLSAFRRYKYIRGSLLEIS